MFSALARKTTPAALRSVRGLATEASHKPPISVFGTAARYANATYMAASKQGSLDVVESELKGLAKAATESPAFAGFLTDPMITRDDKSSQIEALLQEKNVSQVTTNLCTVMAGNARLADLPKVAGVYEQLMKAKRGEVDATITSADTLTKKEMSDVAAAIKATSKGASEVIISSKVDPSIIGGIQVQIGDQFLDLSIKSTIEEVSRTSL